MLQWLYLKMAALEDMSFMSFFFFPKEAAESFLMLLVQCYYKSYANTINTENAHISQLPGST